MTFDDIAKLMQGGGLKLLPPKIITDYLVQPWQVQARCLDKNFYLRVQIRLEGTVGELDLNVPEPYWTAIRAVQKAALPGTWDHSWVSQSHVYATLTVENGLIKGPDGAPYPPEILLKITHQWKINKGNKDGSDGHGGWSPDGVQPDDPDEPDTSDDDGEDG